MTIIKLVLLKHVTLPQDNLDDLLKFDDSYFKVSKGAKIRNRDNQVPHLTQDTNGKVTYSQ